MKNPTKAEYEAYLNDLYEMGVTADAAFDSLCYLTNKTRQGGHTADGRLRSAISNGLAGSMLRRLDPVAFNVGYNEYSL